MFVVNHEDTSIKVMMLLLPIILFVFILRQAVFYTLSNLQIKEEQIKYRYNAKPRTTLRSSQHYQKNALLAWLLLGI